MSVTATYFEHFLGSFEEALPRNREEPLRYILAELPVLIGAPNVEVGAGFVFFGSI